ncbi:helix-turn-helix domain-containing protein [Metabacillus dongyingensis]|uniref:helix-turn-helix domain-containing protein n=1 Tax=Metabacillus dongyingensis TaxID=2874282 RepID=UPI001CBAD6A1|nr:helix-turn-helix transcriptional regulator [Metabacillus dongyingensis]UAL53510.1 helix-turn-helix domain-containing protein [Metabacillus dongyingensis]
MQKDVLRNVRLLAEMTQQQLAIKTGVHHTLLSKIESGKVPLQPVLEQKILKAVGEAGVSGNDITMIHSLFESRKMNSFAKGDK